MDLRGEGLHAIHEPRGVGDAGQKDVPESEEGEEAGALGGLLRDRREDAGIDEALLDADGVEVPLFDKRGDDLRTAGVSQGEEGAAELLVRGLLLAEGELEVLVREEAFAHEEFAEGVVRGVGHGRDLGGGRWIVARESPAGND